MQNTNIKLVSAAETQRTLSKLLFCKFLDHIENSTMSEILTNILLSILAIFTALVFIFPNVSIEIAQNILLWKNCAILKTIASFLFFFNFQTILEIVRSIIPNIKFQKIGETVEGIPVSEILDHLFEFESFKRDDIEEKF